ncbi:MAG: cation:proton antiporter [Thermoleophilaceae bacterium]
MSTNPALALALLVVFAVGAQLLAHALAVPQIVTLLALGVLGGPDALGIIDPDELLGTTLEPLVTLAVGVVLFDGARNLRHEDLVEGAWRPVARLVTLGVLVSWGIGTLASRLLLDLDWSICILIGAILTLSGPTVVAPLLHHVRPSARIGAVLEWEGVVVDPIGAILAVLVFHGVRAGETDIEIGEFVATIACGIGIGVAAAAGVIVLLRHTRAPIHLRSTAVLAAVLVAVGAADAVYEDAGLVTAIVVGVAMARSKGLVPEGREVEFSVFGDTLVQLLIGILFVTLAARVDLDAVVELGVAGLALVTVLIFVQRPVDVAVSTAGTVLTRRERLFAAGVMPRGIVVAATASAVQLSLVEAGVEDADQIVPVCFLVIAATVLVYGLTARPLARALGVTSAR